LLITPLLACNLLPNITGDVRSSATSSSTNSSDGTTPTLNVWTRATSRIELRHERWKGPSNNEDIVTIMRLDPKHIRLSVGYQPDYAPSLKEWMKQTDALAVINGGYFDQQNKPVGLLVADGEKYGPSYEGFGGMLSVDSQGNVRLRSLRQQPYDPASEQLQQATQSSPMLVLDGKRTEFQANSVSDRRTVVAMDKQGRLLFIVSPARAFTLDELADLLAASPLDIASALNLDGGASTGLYLNAGSQKVSIEAVTTLPIVLIIK
jgi:exopolysaccharide biosynthesis protein